MQNKCVLPFINQDYNANAPCCVLNDYKDQNLEELVDDHRNNRQSRFCRECYKIENVGLKSKRQFYNDFFSSHLDLDSRSLKTAVVPVGNKCNLYCVMCYPGASTSWFKKYNSMGKAKYWGKEDVIKENIDSVDLDRFEHIEFIGGETLKSTGLWKTLANMKKSVKFSLQTNGTVVLNQKQIELLNSFENFNICFSIDGYGKIFEYIRQPAKWEQVSNNVNDYKKYFGLDRLSTYCTINSLNIFHVDRIMIEIFKLLPSKIDLNMVYAPSEFAFDNLPIAVGKIIEDKNPVFFAKNKITWKGNTQSKKALLDNLEKQDKFSKLSFKKYLPEVHNLLK